MQQRLKKVARWRSGAEHSSEEMETVPILLDFGMTKALTDEIRLAFSKLIVAASELDYGQVLEGFAELGVKLEKENAENDMQNLKFMFRDSAPVEEARERAAKQAQKNRFMGVLYIRGRK